MVKQPEEGMAKPRKFLLTGASGVVGISILECLNTHDEVSILVNRRRFCHLPKGVAQQLKGDISQANFGFTDEQLETLKDIKYIIHSAALTDFTADSDVLENINVSGLLHAKNLANSLDVPLFYISTAFVHNRNGHALNNYEQSKKLAEESITSDVTVIRPSVIIGDEELGLMPKKQGIHNMLKLATKEVIPVIPGNAASLVDVIPRDIVAKAIMGIVDNQLKGEFWLTAGELAKPVKDMLEIGIDEELIAKYGVKFKPPKLMKTETFERLVKPVFMPALPKRFKRMFEETSIYLKYLDMSEGFASDLPELSKLTGVDLSFDIRETLAKNLAAFDEVHPYVTAMTEAPLEQAQKAEAV